jgi:putative intracellular protease/amidase
VAKSPSAVLGGVLPSVDRLVESRYDAAAALVARLRAEHPDVTDDQLVERIVRRFSRELGVVAAMSGGAAAVPGAGTAAAVLTAGADVAYSVSRLGEMVLAIGIAYGHDAASFEERKAWVLAVLSMSRGAVAGLDGLAAKIGAEGGAAALASLTGAQLESINSKLAAKVVAKLSTDAAVSRLGRVLPFGIGAGVGAAGSIAIARSVARQARRFFRPNDPHASMPIDVTATERPEGQTTTVGGAPSSPSPRSR